ncbi:MAG: RIP metalloprotease RseP [Rhodoferax sp.]|uniref:RIP metalloprotease RseP n=1 Tax=Rhodoferax sp. TaxID=50421 RepID=UPI003018BED1
MLTLAAFVLALGLLIAVHEYGHYRVAVACGVKVLRFSIGFGKPLFRWKIKGSSTEFVLAAFPVGGFVKMLDEREAPVPEEERHLAFNTQPLRSRVAIVAAGPVANLLLAVLLYAVVNWSGVQLPAAVLASPALGSIAAHAGLTGGEKIQRIGFEGDDLQDVDSFEDVHWTLTRGALEGRDVRMELSQFGSVSTSTVLLKLAQLDASEANTDLFKKIGVLGPYSRPIMGEVTVGAAADKAGLKQGDVVHQVGSVRVVDGQQLRQLIRASVLNGDAVESIWKINRAGAYLDILVKPEVRQEGDLMVGKIGAYVGAMPELVMVRYGPLDGLWRGMKHTWDVSMLTLKMMGKMVIGESSLKNLSGPLTIADYAGKSAGMGMTQYLLFLALISVSLGVLNLLPLPVLDGGHLMYYLWEGLTGKPVSDTWMEHLQRGGIAILLVMMAIALFNDITRLFS